MNSKQTISRANTGGSRPQSGFSLIEVLVALVVFAIGVIALAQFQGGLSRTSADANARSVAAAAAEEIIEDRRAFQTMAGDGDPTTPLAFDEIVSQQYSFERGGLAFTVTETVEDYYYNLSTDSFSTTDETDNKTFPDMKELTVAVAWVSAEEATQPGFRIDDTTTLSSTDLGTGEVRVSTIIKSTPTVTGGRILTQDYNNPLDGFRPYTPGENPDVISLSLGENRFKESLTPQPRVITRDELVETTFDVITYSQSGEGSLFLRREEFKVVSCTCTLVAPPDDVTGSGYRPTVWAGDEYDKGEQVAKATGLSANNQQSQFCDVCCADHHDGGSGAQDSADDPGRQRYDPWRAEADYWTEGTFAGDHKHYDHDRRGNLVLADEAGDSYDETCRLVRVDGFWHTAQDLRREGLNVFPFDYLDDASEVGAYSDYVTGAVRTFESGLTPGYETAGAPPVLNAPGPGLFPELTTVPTWTGAASQQLRSRGIYVDYLTRDLRDVIDCLQLDGTPEQCSSLDGNTVKLDRVGSGNVLELIPFSEVQLTWLTRWTESPVHEPVEVTNEALATNNAHSRGVASRSNGSGDSTVAATSHRGNIGLTDTDPIGPRFSGHKSSATLTVRALGEEPPPPPGVVRIAGQILSGVSGVQAAKTEISFSDALCDRTPDGFECWLTGENPTLTISNYKKQNTNMAGCSDTLRTTNQSITANNPTTTFSFLDGAGNVVDAALSHDIFLVEEACPAL